MEEYNTPNPKELDIVNIVKSLKDLLDYQEGAIVSRTLMETKGGTVTLFAFDGQQGLSEHTAPFDALVYIMDGEAEVTISGKSHIVREGQMIIMKGGEPHSVRAVKKFKMLLVMLRA